MQNKPTSMMGGMMIKGTLGKRWNQFNGLLFLFLLYILSYAFISGGGSIANHTMTTMLGYAPPQFVTGAIIAFSLSIVVSISTRAVDRIITVLFAGMLIPSLMLKKSRAIFAEKKATDTKATDTFFRVPGGNTLVYFMIAMGALLAVCHTLAMFDLLPVYGN